MAISARRLQRAYQIANPLAGPYLKAAPASSTYYVDVQAAPLDPQSTQKAAVFVDGIQNGAYGNTARMDPPYGYPEYTATPSTPRVRVLKLSGAGVPEPEIDPMYGWYSNTSYGARGIFLDVPVESWYLPATGTDGSMCIWDPANDCLYELWRARWVDGGWVPGGQYGVTFDPNAPGKVLASPAGGRYDGVSQALQGVYPKQNNSWYYGLSASRLMGSPFAIKAREILNGINHDGDIINIDCIKHTLACAIDPRYSLGNRSDTTDPKVSWPAEYSDNWSTEAPAVGVAYGQLLRFPASINFSTWTPSGWNPAWDETPLAMARIVGRAIQRRGIRLIDMGGSFGIATESPQRWVHDLGYDPWEEMKARYDTTHLPGNGQPAGIFQLSHLPWAQLEVVALDYGKAGTVPVLPG